MVFRDGSGSVTYGCQSLEQLAGGEIDSVTPVDGSATYTSEDLTGLLTALLERHTPGHILDHTSDLDNIEHSDHRTAAAYATDAVADCNADLTVTSYVGYASWWLEENLTPDEQTAVESTFDSYAAYDPLVFGNDGALIGSYVDWVQREYVADEYQLTATDPEGATLYAALMRTPQATEPPPEEPAPEEIDLAI